MNTQLVLVVVAVGVISMITLGASAILLLSSVQSVQAFINSDPDPRKAPPAISGDNIYITWWSNKTGNDEVLFRASTDGGATFSDKINLSNTTEAEPALSESGLTQIAAEGSNVVVAWWETNSTTGEPVARISTDNGASFGPTLNLATNGTLGEAATTEEEGPEEGE
jgi:hypothetical protein